MSEKISIERQESKSLTPESVLARMREKSGMEQLELDNVHTLYDDEGQLLSCATKIIWDAAPNEDGAYHGVSFYYESSSGKAGRRAFKEFGHIIVRLDWIGNKISDVIELDCEDKAEVIFDW